MAQSWNIMAGYCGQISLGHAVFFGIGAYGSAYPFVTFGTSPWLGMLIGWGGPHCLDSFGTELRWCPAGVDSHVYSHGV